MNGLQLHILMAAMLLCPRLTAHETGNTQLERLDAAIAASPESGELYVQRAGLLNTLGDSAQALETLKAGGTHASDAQHYGLVHGQALLGVGRVEEGITTLSAYCLKHPESHSGALSLARALQSAHRYDAAASAYLALINTASDPAPDLYIEATRALDAAGRQEETIALLEKALEQLGDVATLQMSLVDHYVSAGRHDLALMRVDEMIASIDRKDGYLLLKAEVLWNAGRKSEARAVSQQGLACIETLPQRIQHIENTRKTRAALVAMLEGPLE